MCGVNFCFNLIKTVTSGETMLPVLFFSAEFIHIISISAGGGGIMFYVRRSSHLLSESVVRQAIPLKY